MKRLRFACLALVGVVPYGDFAIALSGDAPTTTLAAPAALCKEAVVNPVSGHAECVRPPGAPVDPPPPRPQMIKFAVFNFELEDVTPAAALLGQTASSEAAMQKVSSEARCTLAESGRYFLIDLTHAEPAGARSMHDYESCEARIASQAGADQALIGVVRKITQTDYYIVIQISDAQTGKVLDQQAANFAGGPDGWASGVRLLIKHQVLATADEP
jgi:hypothetical protein